MKLQLTARFSVKKNIPKLGNDASSKQDVDAFYNFWLNFQSWRTFESMDEEKADSAERYLSCEFR